MLPATEGSGLFRLPNACEVTVFAQFRTNEIAFQEIADRIVSTVAGARQKNPRRLRCAWLVCSDSGGIYLHEAIAVRGNIRYKNMINRFIVVNSISGVVSLGPGHVLNRPYSERMAGLLAQYRTIPHEIWMRMLFDLLDEMLQVPGR